MWWSLPPSPKDAGVLVHEAQEKLREALQLATLQGDPLGLVIEAQIAMLDGQYQLSVENAEAVKSTVDRGSGEAADGGSERGAIRALDQTGARRSCARLVASTGQAEHRGRLRAYARVWLDWICGGVANRPDMPVPLGMQRQRTRRARTRQTAGSSATRKWAGGLRRRLRRPPQAPAHAGK